MLDRQQADVVIVGAGVLGSALAFTLGEQGRRVLLLEKSLKEPDRISGELLQPGGVAALEELGLESCLKGIDAVPQEGYNLVFSEDCVHLPYPSGNTSVNAIRSSGKTFHHGRFVSKLRQAALSHPNVTVIETTVTKIVASNGRISGVECLTRTKQRDFYYGSLTVVCDGFDSRFRKHFIPSRPTSTSKFWALTLHDVKLLRQHHAEVYISEKGCPVLVYRISTSETRVLIDMPLQTGKETSGGVIPYLRGSVLPSLPARLRPLFEEAINKGKLRCMPNSYLPASTQRTSDIIFLSDALNMRHPLTGGGMTVALNDVVLIGKLLQPGNVDLNNTTEVFNAMKTFHWQRKYLTSIINILAQALYTLFAANGSDPSLAMLQRGCILYLKRGGVYSEGPTGLLAGTIRQPFILFYHFFAVALWSIWIMMGEATAWERTLLFPVLLFRSMRLLWTACAVIYPYILAELTA